MKAISNGYKGTIKKIGRILDSKITYQSNSETVTLNTEQLNSIEPHFKSTILKSAMKQLDIDCNVEIPLETVLNYQFGVLVDGEYEYINYGNYVVYKIEKQEDLHSYKIICYDKMLYSMKEYEKLNITYPITIRDYINAICEHLGLEFKNKNTTFANYNREIQSELYLDSEGNSMGYTFRDVLDELAQVTASTICINELTDELEIRYINHTGDTIDEEFFKDINVNFGKKYGPVNSIVISRTVGEDNVYLRNEQSVADNGLCEIKIKDNQILNFNDRSDYLIDILAQLNGLEYYLNDYSSTGITFYEMCDMYNAKIGDELYKCVMFNDDVNVTQGLEEFVYTEMPEQGETDYTKADKTDRKINQTYFIVDKQNQVIESMVSQIDGQNSKISQITQTVDELNSKISEIADITTSGETIYATFDINNINESEPIMIKVRATNENISYLYPRDNLYPSDLLYMPDRKITFHNRTTNEYFEYLLPDDLLIYDSTHYDEFYLDYDSQTCQVTKRCKYNSDGTVALLDNEVITDYPYPQINLTDGDYTISLPGYSQGYLFVRLMAQNIYTTQFATKAELNSKITQTANEINLEVSKKTNKDEIISSINLSSEAATINANKISLSGKDIDLTGDNITISSNNFNVDTNGNISANNGNFSGKITSSNATITGGTLNITNTAENNYPIKVNRTVGGINYKTYINEDGIVSYAGNTIGSSLGASDYGFYLELYNNSGDDTITLLGADGSISCVSLTQTSLEKNKKNFEKYNNALGILKDIDVYKYNYANENDEDKKHIGFVIGEKFNYSSEITSVDKTGQEIGVELYSMASLCLQAIKEQQEIIENLTQRIEKLERESDK